MTTTHYRYLTGSLILTSPALADVSCQLTNVVITNQTPNHPIVYTFCAAGGNASQFFEDVDSVWEITGDFRHDWTVHATGTGLSRYLAANDQATTVGFSLNFDAGISFRDRTYAGTCTIKQADDGGNARDPQAGKLMMQIVGKPTLTFNDDM